MSSLIANQVKTNICFVSVKLFIVCTIFCATVQTYITHTTITIRSLFLFAYNLLFVILLTRLFTILCSQQPSSNMQLHTRLTELLLTVDRFWLALFSQQNVFKEIKCFQRNEMFSNVMFEDVKHATSHKAD